MAAETLSRSALEQALSAAIGTSDPGRLLEPLLELWPNADGEWVTQFRSAVRDALAAQNEGLLLRLGELERQQIGSGPRAALKQDPPIYLLRDRGLRLAELVEAMPMDLVAASSGSTGPEDALHRLADLTRDCRTAMRRAEKRHRETVARQRLRAASAQKDCVQSRRHAESQLSDAQAELARLEDFVQDAEARITACRGELAALGDQASRVAALEAKNATLEQLLVDREALLKEAQDGLTPAGLDAELERAKDKIAAQEAALKAVGEEKKAPEDSLSKNAAVLDAVVDEKEALAGALAKALAERDKVADALAAQKTELESVAKDRDALVDALGLKGAALGAASKEKDALADALAVAVDEKKALASTLDTKSALLGQALTTKNALESTLAASEEALRAAVDENAALRAALDEMGHQKSVLAEALANKDKLEHALGATQANCKQKLKALGALLGACKREKKELAALLSAKAPSATQEEADQHRKRVEELQAENAELARQAAHWQKQLLEATLGATAEPSMAGTGLHTPITPDSDEDEVDVRAATSQVLRQAAESLRLDDCRAQLEELRQQKEVLRQRNDELLARNEELLAAMEDREDSLVKLQASNKKELDSLRRQLQEANRTGSEAIGALEAKNERLADNVRQLRRRLEEATANADEQQGHIDVDSVIGFNRGLTKKVTQLEIRQQELEATTDELRRQNEALELQNAQLRSRVDLQNQRLRKLDAENEELRRQLVAATD